MSTELEEFHRIERIHARSSNLTAKTMMVEVKPMSIRERNWILRYFLFFFAIVFSCGCDLYLAHNAFHEMKPEFMLVLFFLSSYFFLVYTEFMVSKFLQPSILIIDWDDSVRGGGRLGHPLLRPGFSSVL